MKMVPLMFLVAVAMAGTAAEAKKDEAATSFEEQLNRAFSPQAKRQAEFQKLTGGRPRRGGKAAAEPTIDWYIPNDGSQTTEPCLMSYPSGENVMGYMSHFQGAGDSAFFFVIGPLVPLVPQMRKVSVTLQAAGDPDQTVKALQFPLQDGRAVIAFNVGTMEAALNAMDDTEHVTVLLGGTAVFDADWKGGFAAREDARRCLAAKVSR